MTDFLSDYYLLLKSFHIMAMIAWMAGMFYLPRLFVYHAGSENGSEQAETFKIMEQKLLRIIMNPAMIATWVFGVMMLVGNPALLQQGWMHGKLLLVILMTVLHAVFSRWRKNFARDANTRPAKFYRIWNEAPTILMIGIVLLAVIKPF